MNTNFIQRYTCPVCGDKMKESLISVPFLDPRIWDFLVSYYEGRISKNILLDTNYSLVKCKNCSLIYQEFILSDNYMYDLYENWISPQISLEKKHLADIHLFREYAFEVINICNLLKKRPSEIKVLEFGMGWGFWLNVAKAFGLNVCGVELSQSRIEHARNNCLKVVEDISQLPNNSYDYIYSNQTFEHLDSPLETMKELSRVLSPEGIVHIIIPSSQGIQKKIYSKNWKANKDAIHPLEHINCYNYRSLRLLGEKANLKSLPLSRILITKNFQIESRISLIRSLFSGNQAFFSKVNLDT